MAVSAWSLLVDALIAAATAALPGAQVYDAAGDSDDPGDFLFVGSNNADESGEVSAGEFRQEWANANHTTRDESGDVNCFAVSWNGEGDQKAARDGVFATCEAVAALCRADPSLGVPQLLWTSFGTRGTPSQGVDTQGALCAVEFQISYRARI